MSICIDDLFQLFPNICRTFLITFRMPIPIFTMEDSMTLTNHSNAKEE